MATIHYLTFIQTVYYRPWQGNVFTGICHSVHRGRGCVADTPSGQTPLGRHPPGTHTLPSACWDTPPPRAATAANGTHPTGMHSCLQLISINHNRSIIQDIFFFCLYFSIFFLLSIHALYHNFLSFFFLSIILLSSFHHYFLSFQECTV